jgi:hypothetical protein
VELPRNMLNNGRRKRDVKASFSVDVFVSFVNFKSENDAMCFYVFEALKNSCYKNPRPTTSNVSFGKEFLVIHI